MEKREEKDKMCVDNGNIWLRWGTQAARVNMKTCIQQNVLNNVCPVLVNTSIDRFTNLNKNYDKTGTNMKRYVINYQLQTSKIWPMTSQNI